MRTSTGYGCRIKVLLHQSNHPPIRTINFTRIRYTKWQPYIFILAKRTKMLWQDGCTSGHQTQARPGQTRPIQHLQKNIIFNWSLLIFVLLPSSSLSPFSLSLIFIFKLQNLSPGSTSFILILTTSWPLVHYKWQAEAFNAPHVWRHSIATEQQPHSPYPLGAAVSTRCQEQNVSRRCTSFLYKTASSNCNGRIHAVCTRPSYKCSMHRHTHPNTQIAECGRPPPYSPITSPATRGKSMAQIYAISHPVSKGSQCAK